MGWLLLTGTREQLDRRHRVFHLCSDGVETLGVARSLGWKVHMRCANALSAKRRDPYERVSFDRKTALALTSVCRVFLA
jgi:hypothetical protein